MPDVKLLISKLKGKDNFLTTELISVGGLASFFILIIVLLLLRNVEVKKYQRINLQGNDSKVVKLTPTPTPIPLKKGPRSFSVSNKGNPQFREFSMNEFDPRVGQFHSIKIRVVDVESEVKSVVVTFISDKNKRDLPMKLVSGKASDGEWEATYRVEDSHDYVYSLKFTAINQKNQKSTVEPIFR